MVEQGVDIGTRNVVVRLADALRKQPFDGVLQIVGDVPHHRLGLNRRRHMVNEIDERGQAGESAQQCDPNGQMRHKGLAALHLAHRPQDREAIQSRSQKCRQRNLRDVVVEKGAQQPRPEHG